jgi:hypothetical protein
MSIFLQQVVQYHQSARALSRTGSPHAEEPDGIEQFSRHSQRLYLYRNNVNPSTETHPTPAKVPLQLITSSMHAVKYPMIVFHVKGSSPKTLHVAPKVVSPSSQLGNESARMKRSKIHTKIFCGPFMMHRTFLSLLSSSEVGGCNQLVDSTYR